jgi:parallel beta-helix repeat protein
MKDPVDWWPMFHHDLGHSGYSTSTGPTTNRTLWTYATGSGVYGACPAVAGGVVYVGSSDHNVYALNAATGALIWEYTTGGGLGACPAVAGGVVYVGSDDYNLYALNATTGGLIWKYTTGYWVESSPVVVSGIVYVGSIDRSVYALNATTGALIWKYTTGGYVYSSPAVASGIVYVGSCDYNVYALNATTGALIWKYTTGRAVMNCQAVAGGVVYVGSCDYNVYALNATTGALIWKYTTGNAVSCSSPAVASGIVYVGSEDYNVYALNATTGGLIWKYTTGSYVYSCPAVAGGVVYVGSEDNNLYALNATTGGLIWKYTTGGNVYSSPAVASGIVYVGSGDYNIYAFGSPPQTVYINADGSITPSGAPIATSDNVTYNLTGNIGYPAYYGIVVRKSNIIVDGKAYTVQGNQSGNGLYWTNINNVTIKDTNVENFTYGIYLFDSNNSIISGNFVTANSYYGIYLSYSSSNDSVVGNDVTANSQGGIVLDSYAGSNSISGNNVTANEGYSIWLYYSSNNSVSGNKITNNTYGLRADYSSGNSISGNNVTATTYQGIYLLDSSNNNTINGNNLVNNQYGIFLSSSSGNKIYHNNFNNSPQAFSYQSVNVWDNGYPSGGNYWSDYSGNDSYSGPHQNVSGSDGIGDTPYIIDSNNTDHYPLMQPWTGLLPTTTYINLSLNLVTVGSAVTCTATVSGVNAQTRATGTVTWSTSSTTGNFSQSVCTLSSGNCSTTYIDASPGSVTIAAYYSGDSNYQPSIGSTTVTVVSSGPVYYSKNYVSVQAAINNATAGSNVIVAAGTYSEQLTLNKTLTIIGDPGPDGSPVFGGGGSGVYLTVYSGASGSIVTGFVITSYDEGMLVYAGNCKIYGNSMSSMGEAGIVLQGNSATSNTIYDNSFQNTPTSINLTSSAAYNTIYDNVINSQNTVTLNFGTNSNTIYQNVISGSSIVLNMTNSVGNTFYHNSFLSTVQIINPGANFWNSTYPSGGNYWSDYKGTDSFSGPYQNVTGSDGIGDTPYPIGSSKDNYPLMKPYALSAGHDVAVTSVVTSMTVILLGSTCSVTVSVVNKGQYNETFQVTAYANAIVIGTQQVTNLGSTSQVTLTFTWNTTGLLEGRYTISAQATPAPPETSTADNTLVNGTIQITGGGGGSRIPYMD